MKTLTRTEIAEHLTFAFDAGYLTRAEILTAARTTGARTDVMDALESLPDRTFSSLRDLWHHLGAVPISA